MQEILGYTCQFKNSMEYRGRGNWGSLTYKVKDRTKAKIFASVSSVITTHGKRTETPEFTEYKNNGGKFWHYRKPKYDYNITNLIIEPVFI